MTDSNDDNPYIDEALMDAYVTFSPSENARYLRDHGIIANAEQTPINAIDLTQLQPLSHPLPTHHDIANSQHETQTHEEETTDIPNGDGASEKPPLSYAELSTLKVGDILYILEDAEADDNCVWSRVTFLGSEPDGFRVQTNVMSTDNKYEEMFYGTICDDDIPVMYMETNDDISNNNDNNDHNEQINHMISTFDYKIGSEIFVYDDANNFTFYEIQTFDAESTKVTLKDKSGVISSLYLRNFKHEIASSESKAIEIKRNDTDDEKKVIRNKGKFMDIDSIKSKWTWIERTNRMKLKWISYKNTLFACIVVASKHLYPISLDYRAITFLSGNGMGFHWMDIDIDVEDDDDGCMDEMEQNMKLYLGDSQLDCTLKQITKYSYYKFVRYSILEMVNDVSSGIKRLMDLEQEIVNKLNESVCCITNDKNGHLGLIVGYTLKGKSVSSSPTKYYFKLKTFIARDESESDEYCAIDLYHQRIVITLIPPNKERKYSFQHSFNPSMLFQIVSDLCTNYDKCGSNIDLCGKRGLVFMKEQLDKAKSIEKVNQTFAKQTVFALIRLLDSRSTSLEFIDFIESKIKNAFQSQSGSESEWKFAKIYDISDELKVIKTSLKAEMEAIRRQSMLIAKYITNYDGAFPISQIEWKPIHRAGAKAAITQIIALDDTCAANFNKIKTKLAQYLCTKDYNQITTEKVTDSW